MSATGEDISLVLRSANTAAAALDDVAQRMRDAALEMKRTLYNTPMRCGERRQALAVLTERMNRLVETFSLWADGISDACGPLARGEKLDAVLPRLLELALMVREEMACELETLEEIRDGLARIRTTP